VEKKEKFAVLGVSVIFLVVSVSLIFQGTWSGVSAASPEPKKLTIGALLCLTGWFSGHDVKDWHETQFAADMINERGGITIKGEKYQIEMTVEDGKSSLDGVTAAANRLVFDKKVKFIVGPHAFFSSAVSPVAGPNRVIHVSGFNTTQPGELSKDTPYCFLAHNGMVGEVLASIQFFKKNFPKVKNLAIVRPDDGAQPYLMPILKRAFSDNGLVMAGDPVLYSNESVDLSSVVAKLNAIKGADGVFHVSGILPHFGAVVKGLRQLGNNNPICSMTASNLAEIITIAGKEASKDVFTVGVSPNDPGNPPLMNELTKRITDKYGMKTSIYIQGANCLWTLKEAIEAAQSLDPAEVKTKWESMDKIETLYGTGRMCGGQTYGIKNHALSHRQPAQILKDGSVINAGLIDPGIIP
jgi:branched-chain amino acid transport system substrate-binding protein